MGVTEKVWDARRGPGNPHGRQGGALGRDSQGAADPH